MCELPHTCNTILALRYVSCKFADKKVKYTDTHFRAKNGKASWNWRFRVPVDMDSFMKNQRLELQIWDRDITADDCGGSCQVPPASFSRHILVASRPSERAAACGASPRWLTATDTLLHMGRVKGIGASR